jgi:hypothetical protein
MYAMTQEVMFMMSLMTWKTQEAKYVERAGPTRLLPGLAEADGIFQWIGVMEYIPSYSALAVH